MDHDIRRRVIRRLPGVGWRDAKLEERALEVAELRQRLRESRAKLKELGGADDKPRRGKSSVPDRLPASFRRQLWDLRRSLMTLRKMDPERLHPQWQLSFKLRNYRLAASHGVPTPTVYGAWADVASIDLAALPDAFVLKSDLGHSSHGVFPLRRLGRDSYERLDGKLRYTGDELLAALAAKQGLAAPYFAEEVLEQPGGGPIPDDVKIYCAYGRVLHVMLRRMPVHGDLSHALYRYLDESGRDLGDVAPEQRIDPAVPSPASLTDMVAAAQHLSRAVGVPFCRVDLYDTERGVVLGEITQAPGGAQHFSHEHDRWMGAMWDRARWQLDLEVLQGRPPGALHGSHSAPNPYPAGHVSTLPDPGAWAVRQAACEEWCFRPPLDPVTTKR